MFNRATNVPFEFFENRDGAKKYFRRFGKVKLVMFKPKTRSVLVEYGNEDSMLNALELAGEYKGNIFHIARDPGFSSKKKDEDPDWLDDPEVRAELEAMGGFGVSRSYNLRGEGNFSLINIKNSTLVANRNIKRFINIRVSVGYEKLN